MNQREGGEVGARRICVVVEVLSILPGRVIMISPHCKQGGARHGRESIRTSLDMKMGPQCSSFLRSGILRPSAEESHDTCAEDDAGCSIDNLSERSFIHFLVEEELVRKKLNETSIEQDARAERVEDAAYNGRSGRAGVIGSADTQPDGDSERRRKSVRNGTNDRCPFV